VEDTSVSIDGEPFDEWVALDVVRAIGRGFSPEKALLLTQENMCLELINLEDALGESEKIISRVKGRIIGTEGKSRKRIEELTKCYISVYGKTVGIIGSLEDAHDARDALLKLISGSPHSSVFRRLEQQRKGRKNL
jgi:ribosomal RNA assembly protein